MNEPKSGTEQNIVEAAVQLFSHKGFSGTSTREIAQLANVSETSMFRCFRTKQDIFWAALDSRLQRVRFPKGLQNGLHNQGKPEQVVPLIVELLVHISAYHQELIRLLNVGFLELRPGAERLYRQQLAPLFQAIHEYLERSVKDGSLRDLDPSIVATSFVATVLTHQNLYPVLSGTGAAYANTEEAVTAYSRFWLGALLPVGTTDRLAANVED